MAVAEKRLPGTMQQRNDTWFRTEEKHINTKNHLFAFSNGKSKVIITCSVRFP
jgi:hypothetical protein